MVGPGAQGEVQITGITIEQFKSAVTWAVYRALLYWLLTWLGVAIVFGGMIFAISIPKFANTKELAYQAAMKSDLRNLIVAEEDYFADSARYTSRLPDFAVTPGNTLGPIQIGKDGWAATITNANSPKKCAIFIGTVPHPPGQKEGIPVCE